MHDMLLARISGLRVLDHPANSINEFSAAVVLFESRDAMETLGGRTFGAATWTTAVSYQSTASVSASSGTAPALPIAADFHFRFTKSAAGSESQRLGSPC